MTPLTAALSFNVLCAPCERLGFQHSCPLLLFPLKLDVTCSASRYCSAWYLWAGTLVSIRQSHVLFPCLSDVKICDQVDPLSVWLLELQRWTYSPTFNSCWTHDRSKKWAFVVSSHWDLGNVCYTAEPSPLSPLHYLLSTYFLSICCRLGMIKLGYMSEQDRQTFSLMELTFSEGNR